MRRRTAAALTASALLSALSLAGIAAGAPGDATPSRVADINPGSPPSSPTDLLAIGGSVIFQGTQSGTGTELWKSNGGPLGPGGTELVENIESGAGGSNPSDFTNIAGTILFAAQTSTNGRELWKSEPPYDAAFTSSPST